MEKETISIWIEAECWAPGEWDINNDNTDVVVTFKDGSKWAASFFTYNNIEKLRRKNEETGEYLSGKYFWSSDMILVDKVNRSRIEEVVEHLIEENKFEQIFIKCEAVED